MEMSPAASSRTVTISEHVLHHIQAFPQRDRGLANFVRNVGEAASVVI